MKTVTVYLMYYFILMYLLIYLLTYFPTYLFTYLLTNIIFYNRYMADCLQPQVYEPNNQAQCENSLMHQACFCLLNVSLISFTHQHAYSSRAFESSSTYAAVVLIFVSNTFFFTICFIILYSDRGQP